MDIKKYSHTLQGPTVREAHPPEAEVAEAAEAVVAEASPVVATASRTCQHVVNDI